MPTIAVRAGDNRHLQDIADIVAKSKKVVVVTGAGISTNCGIPDFRSEGGLYSLIQRHYDALESPVPDCSNSTCGVDFTAGPSLLSKVKGRDLFDSLIWKDPTATSVFYTFIASLRKSIKEDVKHTSPTHRFIRTLRDSGKLVRNYSQNIDGLEARLGLCTDLSRGKGNRSRFKRSVVNKPRVSPIVPGSESDGGCEVLQLHGDLEKLRCTLCKQLCDWEDEDYKSTLLGGRAPSCGPCAQADEDRRRRGKRGTAIGTLRPNIILYGEEHPQETLLSQITTHDIGLMPDVLLIMGTSLKVHGLKVLVKEFAKAVHARRHGQGKVIFINNTKPSESVWKDVIDWWVEMDCDKWVHDLQKRRSDIWDMQTTLKLPVVKTVPKSSEKKGLSEVKAKDEVKVTEVDKENPTQVRQARSASRKGETAGLHPLSEASNRSNNSLQQNGEQTPKRLIPRTPRKTATAKLASGQLMTPPSTRHGAKSDRVVSPKQIFEPNDDIVSASPSKRKRSSVDIWVDPVEEAEGNEQPRQFTGKEHRAMEWLSFPRTLSMVEIPLPRIPDTPSKRKKKTLDGT